MKRKIKKPEQGVSLIEILIVVVILGILSFLLSLPIKAQLTKARDARRKLDFNLITKNLEQDYDSIGYYPQTLASCNQSDSIPCDPKTKTDYIYLSDGNEQSAWFKLYANLERDDDQIIDIVGCRYGCGPECQYNFGVSSPNIGLDYCLPDITPTPTFIEPTSTPAAPRPTPILYACSPASGPMPEGQCEAYDDPILSECPKVYPNDPTCANECGDRDNRCRNASGKHKPE
ncbi:MAG: General secretion pathway protein G [Candidatus Roizmanbacteria bacterium GW2011_GWC2_37_13]|uniref:General secretion pathway protein G n=1 Tax=Candidatus Roizmanbacteria bacterium GW2011_GWC2_37_13 TaxID=1618486 RepID=A0A0G0GGE7_9BACT|nr:MAG: General secretion pathway protein G [Candidatus Roizmanbacteria bacterium GW2011_GWC1_37_12]KKQ25125.1 MAG: General secretion pathway protein G [Candidatus Roizmanbacteria bacterium GW2011_GWC2_37_13]